MLPESIQTACRTLNSTSVGELSREALVAFSSLSAFHHHFPSRCTDEISDLIEKFSYLREREPSRYLKQRRIALARIFARSL